MIDANRVLGEVRADVRAARERDPASKGVSTFEILSGWAGVQALLAHRVAHALLEAGVPIAPRAIAYLSRAITGVEIHPAARIGDEFFIDHGSGVVIGETAEIGDRVTLYQGVTLGGTGFQPGKRHPTVGDNVTIGSGAKLLGPISVGDGAKIGANTVVVEDVRRRQPRASSAGRRSAGRRPGHRLDPPAGPDRRGDPGALGTNRRPRETAHRAGWERPAPRGGARAPTSDRALLGRRLSLPPVPLFSADHASDRVRAPE